ncbi:sugar-transfer associated ATP-grasp domain-containing protein [Microbacterium sp.]|uniref:sugar-transfer associated ATP-grasp domain-containing protein n=1 Tax=Microbacterium sp. TaxID=51671 RepID=UPI0037355AA1
MGALHRLYRRARFFVRRVINFDSERVLQFARQSARLTKAPLWWVVIDMIWCSVRYETTFENYSEWDFRILKPRERKTYMTDPKSFHLSRRLNDNAQRAIFDDKLEFAQRFGAELGREWIDLRVTDAAAFAAFTARHPRIIAKNPGGVGGNGISLRESASITDPAAVREELIAAGQVLVEEVLVQHPDMARLYPDSVNSLRMVSYLDPDGEVHVLAGVLKIGNGGVIDNFSNGGMYTMLDERGRAMHPASDEEGHPFAEHPVTGVAITGFTVPLYDEVLDLVDRLARRVPAFPYIGWDIAITPEGPVVIEGNHNSGVFQSKPSVSGIRQGLLPRYRAAMRF